MKPVCIIGAGLAGSEAAWRCARRGVSVELFEMRPERSTPAHQSSDFAELVCSNSLKSESENTAPWLLKEEMRRADSLLLKIARECSVPAGHALAVDRETFARAVTSAICREPLITVSRKEAAEIDGNQLTIIATGPLTSDALVREISRLSSTPGVSAENSQLYFYDSISPIVEAESIDMSKVYRAARYDKGTADYINCPFSKEEYDRFYDALVAAQSAEQRDWENLNYFESCLPIEEIARRGRDTLRFGPMKPVGLKDPRSATPPYAVVQPAARKSACRFLQYCWISEPSEVRRAGACTSAYSRTGECAFSPLRPNPSQHIYQLACAAGAQSANEGSSGGLVRRTNLRS